MTRDAYHQELREIEEAVVQMATLVEAAIARATQALTQRDTLLAEEVIAGDDTVNEMQRSIRNRCISVMARQAPVARDLREISTVQLVINELERMGDHAAGIAKQTLRLRETEQLPLAGDLLGAGGAHDKRSRHHTGGDEPAFCRARSGAYRRPRDQHLRRCHLYGHGRD